MYGMHCIGQKCLELVEPRTGDCKGEIEPGARGLLPYIGYRYVPAPKGMVFEPFSGLIGYRF